MGLLMGPELISRGLVQPELLCDSDAARGLCVGFGDRSPGPFAAAPPLPSCSPSPRWSWHRAPWGEIVCPRRVTLNTEVIPSPTAHPEQSLLQLP